MKGHESIGVPSDRNSSLGRLRCAAFPRNSKECLRDLSQVRPNERVPDVASLLARGIEKVQLLAGHADAVRNYGPVSPSSPKEPVLVRCSTFVALAIGAS